MVTALSGTDGLNLNAVPAKELLSVKVDLQWPFDSGHDFCRHCKEVTQDVDVADTAVYASKRGGRNRLSSA